MTTLLQINSSIFAEGGQSTQLADYFVGQYLSANPETHVTKRDLAGEEIKHFDAALMTALMTEEGARSDEQIKLVEQADAYIAEFREASAIVLALPMYNFGLPSQLKAYFDHLARAGDTFKYTENGPVGLLKDKPVYVMAARGGIYEGTSMDTQTDYVIHFLRFLGIEDVRFVYAEGLNMGGDAKENALAKAHAILDAWAA